MDSIDINNAYKQNKKNSKKMTYTEKLNQLSTMNDKRKVWVVVKPKTLKVKKIKKPSRSKLVHKLDSIFSQYVRLLNITSDWKCVCVTCGAIDHRKNMQNWHFISRWNYKYRWDEKNCHVQCYVCNILKKWNYMFYTRFMQKRIGEIQVDKMMEDKELIKIPTPILQEMIDKYSAIVEKLKEKEKKVLQSY